MELSPKLKVDRAAQIAAGDLFIYQSDGVSYVAMNAVDPAKDGDIAFVTLGPTFPDGVIGPTLANASGITVVSFGKEFMLRLPCEATGWTMAEPPPAKPAILVTDRGVFFRANFLPPGSGQFKPCYIDAATGIVQATQNGRSYAVPHGLAAFATKWELLTREEKSRGILSIG